MSGPWRLVTHIGDTTGPRGGRAWSLTLSCGHSKAVRMPRFRPGRDILDVHHKGTRSRHRKFTAPLRVRCLLCPPKGRR